MLEDKWFIYQHPPGHYETPVYRNGCAGFILSVEQCPWTTNGFKPEKLEIAVQIDACVKHAMSKLSPEQVKDLADTVRGYQAPDFVPPDGTKDQS